MWVTLVNPPLVSLRNDVLGSGIAYMPVSLAYLAAYLRQRHRVTVIDGFGDAPLQKRRTESQLIQGLAPEQIAARVPAETEVIFLYANNVVSHDEILRILAELRSRCKVPLIVFENTQAVTAYALSQVADSLLDAGASALLTGEAEIRVDALLDCIRGTQRFAAVDGLIYREGGKTVRNPKTRTNDALDALPFPAWELLPLQQYWNLGYAHGPRTMKKYLPLLTSRGCPFGCTFCVVPATNNRRWKARSASNVADELQHFYRILGVREFHLEDLNPTIRKERMADIAREIINRRLPVVWKISAGTKIETLDKETITLMARAGLAYLSFSPESGSPRILKLMDKPFNHALALDLAKHLHAAGVRTQACFVLGHPGETADDRVLTREYVLKLAGAGVDEVALFIMTPIPGSAAGPQVTGYTRLSQLTFSPTWRSDYAALHRFRLRLYAAFHLRRLLLHPVRSLLQPFHVLSRRFSTKTEMAAYRYFVAHLKGSA